MPTLLAFQLPLLYSSLVWHYNTLASYIRMQKYLFSARTLLPKRVIGYCYAQQLPEWVIMHN